MVVDRLLRLEVSETVVAEPLSTFMFIHVEEERRKIFNPGKVLIPIEQIDMDRELLFGKVNWKAF